jgi:hypothetical protein
MKTLDASDIVFVYGALRSGTTVFRLMLDAHPQIANPGEMDFLFDYLHLDKTHPTGWRYDLNELKLNRIYQVHAMPIMDGLDGLDLLQSFMDYLRKHHSGMILSINIHRQVHRIMAIMPNAHLIHMLRDPRDVARSSIVMGWAGTTYHAVNHWIKTESSWDAVMTNNTPQHLMTFQYETLFADTEGTLKEVCAFLELPYDPKVMEYYIGTTYSAPDSSLVQQWRKKADPNDIALVEYRAGALMAKRGYPVELPPVSLSTLKHAQLFLRNKTTVWRFGIKRHGWATFATEKLTRWLRLRPLHRSVRLRMNQTERKMVK